MGRGFSASAHVLWIRLRLEHSREASYEFVVAYRTDKALSVRNMSALAAMIGLG